MAPTTSAEIHIRRARAEDAARLVELLQQDTMDPNERNARRDDPAYVAAIEELARSDGNQLLVAEVSGRVVGTFQLTFIRGFAHRGGLIAQIEGVRIASEMRNRGLGSQMMRWAIARARERGAFRVQLTSNKRRLDAHRFYERLGFERSHVGMKLVL